MKIMAMLESVLTYLQWAFPCGLGAAIGWLLNGRVRHARTARAVHDTYKGMYADVSRELREMRIENEKLYKAIGRLERAVSRATACRYWSDCPIRHELPQPPDDGSGKRVSRHVPSRSSGKRERGDGGASVSGRQCERECTSDDAVDPS